MVLSIQDYQDQVEDNMNSLIIDTKEIKNCLVQFIQETMQSAGFSKIVIGLSGGIDSALSCYLAVSALGAENVCGIRMPYKTSSKGSLDDAQRVIDNLGIGSLTIPITDMVDPLFNQYPDMNQLRKGNIMARMRMIVLYDQSAAYNGLVIGTGNKTEILLGYTTLFGDSACAFNPIGDLYKTQVRQLSKYMHIPDSIIKKSPSADLWQGQTDESELGFSYADVDKLLYQLVENNLTEEECIEQGFEKVFVTKVINIIRTSNFKRILPPIASIGQKNIQDGIQHLL